MFISSPLISIGTKLKKMEEQFFKDFPDKIQLLILFCLYFKVYLKSAKKEQMHTNLSTMLSKQRSYNSWPETLINRSFLSTGPQFSFNHKTTWTTSSLGFSRRSKLPRRTRRKQGMRFREGR